MLGHKVNPKAEIVRTEHSVLEPAALLGTARFSMQRAAAHPQWLVEAREHEHTPETLEYGISSFVFRASKPFHPERLHAALGCAPTGPPRSGALASLLRAKGFAWLATWPGQQAHVALAGTQFTLEPGPLWKAANPSDAWSNEIKEEMQQSLRAAEDDLYLELELADRTLADGPVLRLSLRLSVLEMLAPRPQIQKRRGEELWGNRTEC